MKRGTRAALFAAAASAAACAIVACGSRTGLLAPEENTATVTPGPHHDVLDAGPTAPDATLDASTIRDVALDQLPPLESGPVDANRTDCPDADSTLVYVVSSTNELFAFYPPDLSFRPIGTLVCPNTGGASPFSMAVDRKGVAYVVYTDGRLFRVSTLTAACVETSFATGQSSFDTFGMGFSSNAGGPAETMYVVDSDYSGATRNARLATVDTTSFKLSVIGPINPAVPRAELTGTGDGRLFAYWGDPDLANGSHVAQIDKSNAQIVAQTFLPNVGHSRMAFAFAFWGGDFWLFTSRGTLVSTGTDVSRFTPGSPAVTVSSIPSTIVGAGVSTCAPPE